MTPQGARHAVYAAALAIENYVHPEHAMKQSALDLLDEVLDEIRIAEATQRMGVAQ